MRIGLAQRMDRRLRSAAPGDEDLAIGPRLLDRPQQQRPCPAAIRIAIELAVPIEIAERCRIGVVLVKRPHRFGPIDARR